MDFGRPSHVRVVALVDRGHRELDGSVLARCDLPSLLEVVTRLVAGGHAHGALSTMDPGGSWGFGLLGGVRSMG